MIRSCSKDLTKGNISRVVRDTAGLLSGIFVTAPFLAAFRHLCNGRPLADKLAARFQLPKKRRRVLWFTDSIAS